MQTETLGDGMERPPILSVSQGLAGAKSPTVRKHGVTNVLGVPVAALDLNSAVQLVAEAVATGERGYICVRDAHGLILCQSDPDLRRIHTEALAVTSDGMPLVWALHADGHKSARRVYGPNLMQAVFAHGLTTGMRHFLYGTTPENLLALETRLLQMFPKTRIVGAFAPPFRPLTSLEEDYVCDLINASEADVVWVGLSTPKQEKWMSRMRGRLTPPVLLGVGAAFDFIGGNKAHAPKALQDSGLEWVFRLVTEPRRLWRRYARVVPAYLMLRMLQKTGLRAFPIPEPRPDGAADGEASDPGTTDQQRQTDILEPG